MTASKSDLLADLTFGERVAEEEGDGLASYFVETDQWRRVALGRVDVVFGVKGAGKSAIYSTLLKREAAMLEDGIVLISGENPRGTPAFKDLVSDPPTSEPEFVGLWKLYILSLVAVILDEHGIEGPDARAVKHALAAEGLLPAKAVPLRSRLKLALDYVRRALKGSSVEGSVGLGDSGMPEASGKITLGEPSLAQSSAGAVSVDMLLNQANSALLTTDLQTWLLFDRLDVAFAESRELESNGLRALFKTYLDLLSSERINLKIFLRSDVWASITAQGFREASHITRQLTISWSNAALLDLVVNRLLQNAPVLDFLEADAQQIQSAAQKRALFDRIVPEKVDAGRNPQTFEWVLSRAQDGSRLAAPREVIHLLTEARNAQLALLERAEEPPPGTELLSRQALREALPPVSKVRLEQTIYAEYPELKVRITALEEEKTEHTPETLAGIWGISLDEAKIAATRLVEIGFFEARGDKRSPRYWVPFLYRPALQLVQGQASVD